MGDIKIAHYVVKRGRGFWQPTAAMRRLGFESVPCGSDGPSAWAIAEEWNRRWQATRLGLAPSPALAAPQNLSFDQAEELTVYPPNSIGAGFKAWRKTNVWASKELRTREDYERAWRYLKAKFGDVDPRTVDLRHIDAVYTEVLETAGQREAHRMLKSWRVLWRALADLKYCDRDDPSSSIRNVTPPARTAIWQEGEVVRLVKCAIRKKYLGLAALIAVGYDTAFSPVDARTLTAAQRRQHAGGTYFEAKRAKTGRDALGTLTRRSERLLDAYLSSRGVELHDAARIFCNRSGKPYSKDTLTRDFRVVRTAVFGAEETRKLMDLRRTANVEGIAGGATSAQRSAKLANTVGTNNFLDGVYGPVQLTPVLEADRARRIGRAKIRMNEAGSKVGTRPSKKLERPNHGEAK